MTPETQAGKDAAQMLCHFDWCSGLKGPNDCDCGVDEHIVAIEASLVPTADLDRGPDTLKDTLKDAYDLAVASANPEKARSIAARMHALGDRAAEEGR